MQTYLSTENLKSLKNYLNTVLPKRIVEVLQSLEAKGLELDYDMNYGEKNKHILWQYISDELSKQDTPTAIDFNRLAKQAHFHDARIILNQYISENYAKEWQVITEDFKPNDIQNRINGVCSFCSKNHVDSIDLKALIMAKSFDEYLQRYEAKNVDKELLKTTDRIAEYIDQSYYGKRGETAYYVYQNAIKEYMQTGNKQLLHNLLQKTE
jgi:hypothetical protein